MERYQRAATKAYDIIGNLAIFFPAGEGNGREKNNTKTLLKLIEFSCGNIRTHNKLIIAQRNP